MLVDPDGPQPDPQEVERDARRLNALPVTDLAETIATIIIRGDNSAGPAIKHPIAIGACRRAIEVILSDPPRYFDPGKNLTRSEHRRQVNEFLQAVDRHGRLLAAIAAGRLADQRGLLDVAPNARRRAERRVVAAHYAEYADYLREELVRLAAEKRAKKRGRRDG